MAEWLKAPVLKTGVFRTEGSNPSLSVFLAVITQLVEYWIVVPRAVSSNLTIRPKNKFNDSSPNMITNNG